MAKMSPKEFISAVLIHDIGKIHTEHAYVSFAMMAIGIEFLGKCLNDCEDWNQSGRSRKDFELAINKLKSFRRYRKLLPKTSYNLHDSFRNGFAHSFVPKKTLSLSSKNETPHLKKRSPTKINLKCEDLYVDFKMACEEVINRKRFKSKKMGKPFLNVPDPQPLNISYSGTSI